MAPDLLFHPVFNEAEALAGVSHRKVGLYGLTGPARKRQASIDVAKEREMKAQGVGATDIAKALGIGRASVYRVLEAAR
jgi:AcrR family transcriptional regulator